MSNPTAAMLVIGDEILSGRTRDTNTNYLAVELTNHGIQLTEVRVVADDRDAIIAAVNALPQLTAALRGVLTAADDLDREADEREQRFDKTPATDAMFTDRVKLLTGARHQRIAARRIRSTVAAALSPGVG